MGNGKNSPVIANTKLMGFEDDEEKSVFIATTINEIMEYYDAKPVKSSEEAEERIAQYFIRCAQKGIRPTVEEMSLALGVTRQTLHKWENGQLLTVRGDVIKKAKEIIATFDAKAVINNKMNPVTYFFRAKNYYGMRDQQEVVLTPNVEAPDRKMLIEEAELLPDD